jgi:hypothetical protein
LHYHKNYPDIALCEASTSGNGEQQTHLRSIVVADGHMAFGRWISTTKIDKKI